MPPNMTWLTIVLRLSIAPLVAGALVLGVHSVRTPTSLEARVVLLVLGGIQLVYWCRPWPIHQRRALISLGAIIPTIALLQSVLHVSQPLLWLYPAIIAGSGLAVPLSAVVVGIMALAAVVPVVPVDRAATSLVMVLGTTHTILLSIV